MAKFRCVTPLAQCDDMAADDMPNHAEVVGRGLVVLWGTSVGVPVHTCGVTTVAM